MSISHLRTSASNAAEMRAISGLRRASDMTSVQSLTCSIERIGEVVMRHAFEHGEKSLRQVGSREILRHLGAVALGDASDQRLLGGEVAVQVAGAHAGLGADLLHRGLMEAGADKAALRGAENLVPAVRLALNIETIHGFIASQRNENERSFS